MVLILSKSEKRVRDKRIYIRVSSEEYNALELKAQKLRVSVAEYLRQLIKRQKIIEPIMSKNDIIEILTMLKQIGNTLTLNSNPNELINIRNKLDKISEMVTFAIIKVR